MRRWTRLARGSTRARSSRSTPAKRWNCLPNIPWTKGDAVRWIVEDIETHAQQPAWCVFFGDDVTDEDAFRAVRRGLTVVVGRTAIDGALPTNSPADVAAVLAHVNSNGHGKEHRR